MASKDRYSTNMQASQR